jgi:hypothetical protein
MLIISLKFLMAPVFGDQAVFVILVLHKLSVFSLVKLFDLTVFVDYQFL